jgi:hypothetical protein
MLTRNLTGGFAALLAGAAMLAISATSASAFTTSSPSLSVPVAGANIDKVWWDRWGRWHPNGPGWGPRPGWGPGPGWRRCWINRWGNRQCNY